MAVLHSTAVTERRDARAGMGSVQRAGGGFGVLGGLSTILVTIVFGVSVAAFGLKPPSPDNPAQAYDYLQSTLSVLLPLFLLVSVGHVLVLLFVRALDERLGSESPALSSMAALFGYLGFAILVLDFMSFVYVQESILAGTARKTVEALIPGLFFLAPVAGLVGSLFVSTWLILVSWIAVRRGGLPRTLAYFGFLAAVVAVIGVHLGLKGIPSLLPSLWLIWAGALMWLRPKASRA